MALTLSFRAASAPGLSTLVYGVGPDPSAKPAAAVKLSIKAFKRNNPDQVLRVQVGDKFVPVAGQALPKSKPAIFRVYNKNGEPISQPMTIKTFGAATAQQTNAGGFAVRTYADGVVQLLNAPHLAALKKLSARSKLLQSLDA